MAQANNDTIDTIYFGNPIQDITVQDDERVLLNKYSLELGMASLASPEQIPIYAEMAATEGRLFSPGGSALNSARAQKHINSSGAVAYFGCIGNDDFGKSLQEEVAEAGVDAKFSITDEHATGTCACVIVGKERTLCANIAAAKAYPTQHIADNLDVLAKAKYLYTTGFFVDSNFEAVKQICDFAKENNKPLGFNLSAVFVIQFYAEQVKHVLKYSDFVFCNEDEGGAYAQSLGLEATNFEEAAKTIAKSEKENKSTPRVVIFTLGAEPTLVVTCMPGEEPVVEYSPLDKIPKEKIVDTNGAGDSFVGGFFSSLSQGSNVMDAVKAGNTLAGKIIQVSGVNFE